MQTTLLGLGIAIILALVGALVGPYFIDWSEYRDAFETHATRVAGQPVRISGRIDARMLPVPSVTLHDVEVADPLGPPRLRAREMSLAFALGPLARGEWRATELRIAGPTLTLTLDQNGRVEWPLRDASFGPESISVERLEVEDGQLVLIDAARDARFAIDQLSFKGDARSLVGPIRGEGGFVAQEARHTYRLTTGRASDAGEMRLKLIVDRLDNPMTAETDGVLRFENRVPSFAGGLTLARSPGVVLMRGRALASEPWRIAGQMKASPSAVVFEQAELAYGAEDRALKLGGAAQMKFGERPRLEAVLSARQLDLDRLVALPDGVRRLPLVALRSFAEMAQSAVLPGIPLRVGIAVDTMTLGEATVQAVRGDFQSNADGWEIETLEFRAPGFAQMRASGRVTASTQGYAFQGPASIQATDPKALVAWLEGRNPGPAAAAAPLRASGEVKVGPERIAVERVQAEVDGKAITGRADYAWASPTQPRPRLEAEINAAELDIDAAIALFRSAAPGATLDMPGEFALSLDVGRATMAGAVASSIKARLRLDDGGLSAERFSIGDLAGVAVSAEGRIEGPWDNPKGAIAADIAGSRLDGVIALAERFAPRPAAWLRQNAARLAPAKLRIAVGLERAAPGNSGTLRVDGAAGALRIALDTTARGAIAEWSKVQLRTEGRIEADDGRVLAQVAGMEGFARVAPGAGSLRWLATGPLGGGLGVQGVLTAGGVSVEANGTMALGLDAVTSARAEVSVSLADAIGLRQPLGKAGEPIPLAFKALVTFDDDRLVLSGLQAKVADATMRGRLALTLATPMQIDGRIEADKLDIAALIASFSGFAPRGTAGAAAPAAWSSEPFGARFLDQAEGGIAFTAARGVIAPGLEARDVRGTLQLKPGEAALEDVTATLAGGKVQASANIQSAALGTTVAGRLAVTGADIATLTASAGPRPPATGRISLQAEVKGLGRSPSALAGSFGGSGTVSFEGVEVASLSPQAFAAIMRAVDTGTEISVAKVGGLAEMNLASGPVKLARADGALTINAGQIRLGNVMARGDRADLGVTASIDLVRWQLDARLALLGPVDPRGAGLGRPAIDVMLRGPLSAPQRSVDVSTLVGWLTLRAVDLQAKRLEEAEAERRRAEEALRRSEEAAAAARRAADEAAASRRAADEEAARRDAEAVRPLSVEPGRAPPTTTAVPPPDAANGRPPGEQRRPVPAPNANQAPALPPPVDIRPLPGQQPRPTQRPPSPQRPERESVLRAPAELPPPPRPSVFELLFRPSR